MSNEIIYEKERIQRRILRRRKMIIVDEIYEEVVREKPFEDMFRKVIPHEVLPSFQSFPIVKEGIMEPLIDDSEERKELAKIVGLMSVPEKTINAFEKIIGLFDDFVARKKIDTVNMVKALRKRC